MKSWIPTIVLVLGLIYVGSTLIPPSTKSEFDLRGFARLPVLVDGRIKPLDTVARNSLLMLQGRQRFVAPDGTTLPPVEWLLDVFFNPAVADDYQHILIENPDALAIFGKEQTDQKRFSFNELRSGLPELERQMKLTDPVDEALRSPFQQEVAKLYQRLVLYQRLKTSVNLEDSPDLLAEVLRFKDMLPGFTAALRDKEAGRSYNEETYKMAAAFRDRFQFLSDSGYLMVISPGADNPDPNGWQKMGDALTGGFSRGAVNPDSMAYAGLGHAWRLKQPGISTKWSGC